MAVIGVDSSGKIDQLPCFMVSSRNDSGYCIRITQVDRARFSKFAHWREKLTAIYAFRSIKKMYRDGDMIEFDDDFSGSREIFKKHIDYLLNAYYHKKITSREGRRHTSKAIQNADFLSKYMRKHPHKIDENNPEIEKEWNTLVKK